MSTDHISTPKNSHSADHMKKLTAISLFIFWALVVALLTSGLVFYQNNQQVGVNNPSQSQTGATVPTTTATVTLSAAEIASHNTTSGCWLIIGGKVYNVTSYLVRHPGGISAIAPYCGKDGTAAFEGLPHSTNAHQLLAGYLIGSVGQATTVQSTQPTPIPTAPTGRRAEDND